MRLVVLIFSVLALPQPLSAIDPLDWERSSDRLVLNQALEKLSEQCSKIGFTQVDPPSEVEMEKRIYAHLLLMSPDDARVEVGRWGRYFDAMVSLTNETTVAATSERAGAALTAATMDKVYVEQARKEYVRALLAHISPFALTCTSMSGDLFLHANYLAGLSDLTTFEAQYADAFDKGLSELAAQ